MQVCYASSSRCILKQRWGAVYRGQVNSLFLTPHSKILYFSALEWQKVPYKCLSHVQQYSPRPVNRLWWVNQWSLSDWIRFGTRLSMYLWVKEHIMEVVWGCLCECVGVLNQFQSLNTKKKPHRRCLEERRGEERRDLSVIFEAADRERKREHKYPLCIMH